VCVEFEGKKTHRLISGNADTLGWRRNGSVLGDLSPGVGWGGITIKSAARRGDSGDIQDMSDPSVKTHHHIFIVHRVVVEKKALCFQLYDNDNSLSHSVSLSLSPSLSFSLKHEPAKLFFYE